MVASLCSIFKYLKILKEHKKVLKLEKSNQHKQFFFLKLRPDFFYCEWKAMLIFVESI